MAKQVFKLAYFDLSAAAEGASADQGQHGAVDALIRGIKKNRKDKDRPLKERPGAGDILKKDPAWTVGILRAFAEQDQHYAEERGRLAELEPTAYDFSDDRAIRIMNIRDVIAAAASQLLRRKLPFAPEDYVALMAWMRHSEAFHLRGVRAALSKQLTKAAKDGPLAPEVIAETEALIESILGESYIDNREEAAPFAALVAGAKAAEGSGGQAGSAAGGAAGGGSPMAASPAVPAPAGSPLVMWSVKKAARLLAEEASGVEPDIIGLDEFPMPEGHPLASEHGTVTEMLEGLVAAEQAYSEGWRDLLDGPGRKDKGRREGLEEARGQSLFKVLGPVLAAYEEDEDTLYLAAAERMGNHLLWATDYEAVRYEAGKSLETIRVQREDVTSFTGQRDLDFDRLLLCAAMGAGEHWKPEDERLLNLLEGYAAAKPLTEGERYVVHWLRSRALPVPPMGILPESAMRLSRLIDGEGTLLLVPEDRWVYRLHADLAACTDAERSAWSALLEHALTARSAKPSAKWSKLSASQMKSVGEEAFRTLVMGWMAEVSRGRAFPETTESNLLPAGCLMPFNDGNADVLRGLTWMLAAAPDASSPRAVADLLATSIRKTPGVGPRAVKVANACIWALGEMAIAPDRDVVESAVGQLARLKAKVTFKTTLKAIEKALDKAADAAGMSKADLEELGVPDFEFVDGLRSEAFGDASVELRVTGSKVTTEWTNDQGKVVKAPPASVKRDFKDELKEIKGAAKDADGVLSAGRSRLDGLYLADAFWTLSDWRERWLDHGLLGTLARRLIWSLDGTAATFDAAGAAVGLNAKPLKAAPGAEVRLWHPIDAAKTSEVLAWRDRLADLGIVQPFKQAHREIYALTDAERATGTYSNRFAAHIVRQHQFNALAKGRGWDKSLQLAVDMEDEPAARGLPAVNLLAEFWINTLGEYGEDTTESGAYRHLATDQVRFYPQDDLQEAEALPLSEIPPRILSEVLRDCDLMVGVASVGNDPTWEDGGPEGHHRDYWASYSFGDLGATAKTRREVLERLVPQLTIKDVATIDDKWLCVKGTKQTYKIHLGSGNILMDPGDRYLCIVPDSKAAAKQPAGKVMLPFEGDRMLSIILSKALMLAADDKIKDKTILSQIGG